MPFGVERHELNETNLDTFRSPEFGEVENLVVVHTAFDDRVDLDAGEAGRNGGVDSLQHAHQLIAARHGFELGAVERVEADVHSTQTRGFQFVHAVGECRTIRGEGQIDGLASER